MLTLTKKAKEQVNKVLSKAVPTNSSYKPVFRISVVKGGCTGFEIKYSISKLATEDYIVYSLEEPLKSYEGTPNSAFVVVDPNSMIYLNGGTLDYKESTFSSMFTVEGMKSKRECGCGNSFSF